MTVATFDTCAAAKTLRDAGFDERQAEAAVAMVRDAVTEGVATKADVARLEPRIAELKVTMLLAVFGAAGLLFAALAFARAGSIAGAGP